MTDVLGREYITTFDPTQNSQTFVGPDNARTSKTVYDAAGRVWYVYPNMADSSIYVEYQYDLVGNLTSVRDEMGHTTVSTFDKLNRVESITDAEQGVTNFEYDANGNLTYQQQPNGAETLYGYDALNRQDRVGLLNNGMVVSAWGAYSYQYGYDFNGNLAWEKDPNGNVTNYGYNNLDQLVEVLQPDPGTGDHGRPSTTYTYWPDGSTKRVTGPTGIWTESYYDVLGRLDAVDDPEGTTDYRYSVVNFPGHNPAGASGYVPIPAYANVRQVEVEDKENRVTSEVFDPASRSIQTTLPDPGTGAPVTFTSYDAFDNPWVITDPLGRQTYHAYDGFDRWLGYGEKMLTEPLGSMITVVYNGYNADGTVQQSMDRAGTVTSFTYDNLKRRRTSSTPNNGLTVTTEWTYDPVGNVTSVTSPNQDVTTFRYDDLNHLSEEEITLDGTPSKRSYQYDAAGNLLQKTDRNGRIIEFAYDNLNRRIEETWIGSSDGYVANYHYRANGQLAATNDVADGTQNSGYGFTYDSLGQPDQVTQTLSTLPSFFLYDYDYDSEGRLEQRQLFKGATPLFTTIYAFDALDRLDLVSETGAAVQSKSVDYVYNGMVLSDVYRHQAVPGNSSSYASHSQIQYTSDYQLSDYTHYSSASSPNLAAYHVEYDDRGIINRYFSEVQGTLDAPVKRPDFDDLNQLQAVTDDAGAELETYDYDANGNRLGLRDAYDRVRDDAFNHYDYDNEGHVIRRKSYEQKWTQSFATDMDWSWWALGQTAATVETPNMVLTTGSYRLRLASVTLTSPVAPGPMDVYLVDDTGMILQNFTLVPQPTGNLNEYATPGLAVDFILTENLVNDPLALTFDFPVHAGFSGPDIELAGQFTMDRGAGTYEYAWDYRDRLTQVKVFNNPNSTGATPAATIDYSYDVFDNRIARVKTGAPNVEPNDARYYVPEQRRVLLEYDEQQRLERQHLYAANVDQLLAVEDLDWDAAGNVVSDEVIWLLTDHQGTVRDLQGVDSLTGIARTEHLSYDTFGAPLDTVNAGADVNLGDAVRERFAGLTYDFDASHYMGQGSYYDPYSGRLLSENRLAALTGETNRYRFAGNSPVDIGGAGRPTAVNPVQAARDAGSGFGEMFSHAVNPANQWRDGNYGMAIAQGLGWTAFVVGSAGAGLLVGGTTAAGTVTIGSIGTYVTGQAGISTAETAVEGSLAYAMGSDYNWAAGFGKNMFVNTATGGLGGGVKWGGRAIAYLARQGIEVIGDTAFDVGVHGNDLGYSLAFNTAGSVGGEALFKGLGRGWRAFNDNFQISFDNRSVFAGSTLGGLGDLRFAPRGTIGLGKSSNIAELGDVSIARGRGWTRDRLTDYDSDSIEEFFFAFREATANAKQIHFNLNGVNVRRAWLEAGELMPQVARRDGLVTEWELRQVIANRDLLKKTTFFHNGRAITGKNYDEFYDYLLTLIK